MVVECAEEVFEAVEVVAVTVVVTASVDVAIGVVSMVVVEYEYLLQLYTHYYSMIVVVFDCHNVSILFYVFYFCFGTDVVCPIVLIYHHVFVRILPKVNVYYLDDLWNTVLKFSCC